MVSVAAATRPHRSGLPALFRVLRSRLLALALAVQGAGLRKTLTRLATAGSAWAALALAFGGFYDKPWQLPAVVVRVAYTIVFTLCEYAARGFKPLFAEWSLSFEVARAVTRCLMVHYGGRMGLPACARHIRRQSALVGTALGIFLGRKMGLTTQSFTYNGLEHVWVRAMQPDEAASDKPHRRRVTMLYFHGGGYAVLSPRMYINFAMELQHRIHDRLRDKLGPLEDVQVDVLLANYRKIPEHAHPVPVLDAVTMYKYLLDHEKLAPSQILIAGDSAGAGLTMATLLRIRDEDASLLPAGAVLSCPFVDLEVPGDERKAPYCIISDASVQSIQSLYHPRKGEPSTWGDASPVHCDLRGLPPVYIQAAELDYLLPHATRLYAKAKADGVADNWDLDIFHNVPHVFSFFPSSVMPSAARGLDAMGEHAATKFFHAMRTTPSA